MHQLILAVGLEVNVLFSLVPSTKKCEFWLYQLVKSYWYCTRYEASKLYVVCCVCWGCLLSLVISNVILDCHCDSFFQANYINALAVSVSPFFEPAEVTLGGLIFFLWVDFL
jgi:hypothetical protein